MMIKFTTTDGRTIETTDKNVLFEAARKGEITPDTVFECNGQTMRASQIAGMEFGTASSATESATPKLPRRIVATISNLRGLIYLIATLNIIGAIFMLGSAAMYESLALLIVSIGIIAGAIIGACMSMCIVDILEYISENVAKSEDNK